MWSVAFDGRAQQDAIYGWLCRRLDRWSDWGALASEYGAVALTHRLMAAMAASLAETLLDGDRAPDLRSELATSR